MDLQYIDYL